MRNLQRIHHGGSHRITDRTRDCLQKTVRRFAHGMRGGGELASGERPGDPGARSAGAPKREREVNVNSILLGLLGWGLGFLFVVVLLRTAGARNRAALHEKKRDSVAAATTTRTDDRATDRR